jgi:Sigma 54 modulation protein / S30EA ribosomal protein
MCASARLAATAAAEPRAFCFPRTWQCMPSACSGSRSCLAVRNFVQSDVVPCRGMALPHHTYAMAAAACVHVHTLITDTSRRRRQRAEITVYTLRNGVVRAEDEEDSLYAAIDLVSDKVGRCVRMSYMLCANALRRCGSQVCMAAASASTLQAWQPYGSSSSSSSSSSSYKGQVQAAGARYCLCSGGTTMWEVF